jgi:hypothetical protein
MTQITPNGRARATRVPLATAMGGGGAFGIAFHLGIAHALIEEGVAVDQGPMLGVSAGAYVAAALVTDTPLETIAEHWSTYANTRARGRARTHDITGPLFGDRRDRRVIGVCSSGRWPAPILLSGADHGLGDVVAAAASPLGLAHGHDVGGRRLYDAGICWNTAAHRAPRADLLIVIAALTGDHRGPMAGVWESQLRMEMHALHLTGRRHPVIIRPDTAVLRAGTGRLGDLFDMRRAPATYRAAYLQGQRLAPGIRALHDSVADGPHAALRRTH